MSKVLYCHPDHRALLLQGVSLADSPLSFGSLFAGMTVRFRDAMPRFEKRWVFPKEHGWVYEPKDEKLCRYFGWGHEEETNNPLFLIIDEAAFAPTISTLCMIGV